MDERRQLPRWEIKKEVKVLLPQSQGVGSCFIEDMHLKGMCVSFNKPLQLQNPMRMGFAIGNNSDFIKIEANRTWMKEDRGRYVYGLIYSKIADSDKERIYQFINANCYDQLKDKWWA